MARLLGVVNVCSCSISVWEGDSADNSDMGEHYGVFYPDRNEIWVNAGMPKDSLRDTLMHEVLHALIGKSGAFDVTAATLGLRREDPRLRDWEESIVRVLTPHIAALLKLQLVKK